MIKGEIKMKKSFFIKLNKVLSVLLSIAIVAVSAPFVIFAESGGEQGSPTEEGESFVLTVADDSADNPQAIEGASVSFKLYDNDNSLLKAEETVTNAEGKAKISYTWSESAEYTVRYEVSKEGYETVSSGFIFIGSGEKSTTVTLKKGYKVTLEIVGDGLGEISGDVCLNNDNPVGYLSSGTHTLLLAPQPIYYIEKFYINEELQTVSDEDYEYFDCEITGETVFKVKFGKHDTYKVTVKKEENKGENDEEIAENGGGTVYFDDEETESFEFLKPGTADKTVKIIPDENHLIESVSVDGVSKDISDPAEFSETMYFSADTEIVVKFIKQYSLDVQKNGGGSVSINNQDPTGNEKYKCGSSCDLIVNAEEGYQIQSVVINGEERITESVADRSNFESTLVIDKNSSVNVIFVKVYKVTVNFGNDGSVTINEETSALGGTVSAEVAEGGNAAVVAVPDENFRVLSVSNSGTEFDKTYNDNSYTYNNPLIISLENISADRTITIAFAPLLLNVSVEKGENIESAELSSSYVDYGESCTLTVKVENGYTIDRITFDKQNVSFVQDDTFNNTENTVRYTVSGITEDTVITVTAKKSAPVYNGFTWDSSKAVQTFINENVYVFSKDETVKFSANNNYSGIMLTFEDGSSLGSFNQREVTVDKNKSGKKITGILLYNWWWATAAVDNTNTPVTMTLIFGSETADINISQPQNTVTGTTGFYSGDVELTVSVSQPDRYPSGIERVYYEISKGSTTESKDLYNDGGELKTELNDLKITVDSAKFNGDNIKVTVYSLDKTGTEYSEEITLVIYSGKPDMTVEVDGSPESENYFKSERTATITVTDPSFVFNENGLKLTVTDKGGNPVPEDKMPTLGSWEENTDTHKITLTFSHEGYYNWSISYTNKAGTSVSGTEVTVNGEYPLDFAVDKTVPEVIITSSAENWTYTFEKIIEALSFGAYKNTDITTEADVRDELSGVKSVLYYKGTADRILSADELRELYEQGDFIENKITVSADEEFVIYVRAEDNAGNYIYRNSDRIIFDSTEGFITLTLPATDFNGCYNKDFSADVGVDEEKTAGAVYSGIKKISYKIVLSEGGEEKILNSADLYTAAGNEPHKKDWSGTIYVNAEECSGDGLKIIVTVIDNAGNEYFAESEKITVCGNAPKISLSYDNNNGILHGERGYFSKGRKAVLTIADLGAVFDAEAAKSSVTVSDPEGNILTEGYTVGEFISDKNTHTLTVAFTKDGYYSLSIGKYTNKAGVSCETDGSGKSVIYLAENTMSAFEFVIDTVAPSGTVAVDTSEWDKFLEKLTFGIFKSEKLEVDIKGDDATSPFDVEYYKTSETALITEEKLEELYKNREFSVFEGSDLEKNGVSVNERFVIYARITDYAGNYVYIHSDGAIMDDKTVNITLTADAPNANGIYNGDVRVEIGVIDPEVYSGIKTVEYWVECDGKRTQGEVFDLSKENAEYKDLVDRFSTNAVLSSQLNNSCNVRLFVRATDNAGNTNQKDMSFDIDASKPVISLSYSESFADGAAEGYFTRRTATLVITERTHHFDGNEALNGIRITAKDLSGGEVTDAYTVSGWRTSEGDTPDKTTHTATISFIKDGIYSIDIDYTDKAGNRAENTVKDSFTVDSAAPEGVLTVTSAEGRTERYTQLRQNVNFGFWSRSGISFTQSSEDEVSPIAGVWYYIDRSKNGAKDLGALSAAELDKITEWRSFDSLEITDDSEFVLYLKIADKAGNYSYISTNGLIVDKTRPRVETAAPMISVTPQQPINGIYNGDVRVSVTVADPVQNGAYSGLSEVTYQVFDRDSATPNTPTQEGVIFDFNGANPIQTVTREITVNSALNNSNNIQVIIYAEDNAGNTADNSQTSSQSYASFKIDTTAPTVNISYDNNAPLDNVFFGGSRTAVITVTERNFNPDDVKITITSTDGAIPAVVGWNDVRGGLNGDGSTHTATITYSADGDYTFDIEFTDMAGNKCRNAVFAEGTVAAREFTIDKTAPVITVNYDNNNALNNNYYSAERNATVTIIEHNFDPAAVISVITASDDGENIAAPVISGWTNNGDTHTATVRYADNGLYGFDISYTDKAGNAAADFTQQTFYVDKLSPDIVISGVADKSAYNGDVAPIITFTDTNIDLGSISVKLDGANNGENPKYGSAEDDVKNGRVISYGNFPKEREYDDLYTLSVTVTDMAGNRSEKTITFSANRFGSVYDLSAASAILNKYLKSESDIVFVETNVNGIDTESLKIKLSKNGIPTDLVAGTDYRIEKLSGDGEWCQYRYTINKALFSDDGRYEIFIYSVDEAGNINENIDDVKEAAISFGIDKTAPVIVPVDFISNGSYSEESKRVSVDIKDNLVLSDVKIFLNGEEVNYEVAGESYIFIVPQSGNRQTVRIVALDAAGNQIEEIIENFLVTTDIFVRWYNNTPLFIGSIAGVCLLLIAAAAFFIFGRKKKKQRS